MNYLSEIAAQIRGELVGALPDGDVSRLLEIYAVLVLALGSTVTAADVHNAWAAWIPHRIPGIPRSFHSNTLIPSRHPAMSRSPKHFER